MMSIRAQSAAAVSRQSSSQGENSDPGETQSTSSQNSPAGENLNPIPEDDQTSSQDLLPQNFSSSVISSPLFRQLIRSIFDQTEDIMSITSVLVKAGEIAPLNGSAD
jgi:hypothetical protein